MARIDDIIRANAAQSAAQQQREARDRANAGRAARGLAPLPNQTNPPVPTKKGAAPGKQPPPPSLSPPPPPSPPSNIVPFPPAHSHPLPSGQTLTHTHHFANPNHDHAWLPDVPSDGAGVSAATPQRDWRREAKLLQPWMPDELLDIYVTEWMRSQDKDLALAAMRASDRYDIYFGGNRRKDGTFRYSEVDYMGAIAGYDDALRRYGLNPVLHRSQYRKLIEADEGDGVSPIELAERLAAVNSRIVMGADATKRYFADNFGLELDNTAILAAAINPEVQDHILNRRIQIAEVGGAALRYYDAKDPILKQFKRDLDGVENLVREGMTLDEAEALYGGAARDLPVLHALTLRYYDPDDAFDLDDYEKAMGKNDPRQRGRIERALAAEQSSFSSQSTIRRSRSGTLLGSRLT